MKYQHPQGHVFYRKMNHARPMLARAEGMYLFDADGNRYLDGSGGPLVVNVGHARPEVITAMHQQLETAAYVHALSFTNAAVEEYAAALAEIVPLPQPRFFFLSSGSEVVEAALKFARQVQMARGNMGRDMIICRALSYHGMTLGALSVSGRPGLRTPYMSMLHNMPHIRHPYPYRFPAGGEELASRLEESILAYGPENVAAFIAEPISGASLGAAAPPDDYWPAIRAICDEYGVLLIVDEVLTGYGRTGRWWGIDHWQIQPDIMVSAKGAAAGYFPFGFMAARGDHVELVRQQLGDFNHGGTFSHHAVGAAAGLAVLKILHDEKLVEQAAEKGRYLGRALREALGDHPYVGDIRGRGLFWALELVKNRATKDPFAKERHVAWRVFEAAFARGLLVYQSQGCADGQNGDLVLLGPPLIISRAQIDELVDILARAVASVMEE